MTANISYYVCPTCGRDKGAQLPTCSNSFHYIPLDDEDVACLAVARAYMSYMEYQPGGGGNVVEEVANRPWLRVVVNAARAPLAAEVARANRAHADSLRASEWLEELATRFRTERDEARRQLVGVRTYADECIAADERYADDLAGAQRGITGRHLLQLLDERQDKTI